MSATSYQIRECNHCGLRYPLVDIGSQNLRCPSCLGLTQLISKPQLIRGHNNLKRLKLKDQRKAIVGVLDNIRSALNVGAIFRTADGLGLTHLYLCGITSTPENPEVTKTGLDAQDSIGWSYHRNGVDLVKSIKAEGAGIIVLEDNQRAISIDEIKIEDLSYSTEVVLVVGNELTGVDTAIIDLANFCMHIPMLGIKHSLNVSVAFAIAAYVITSKINISSNPKLNKF